MPDEERVDFVFTVEISLPKENGEAPELATSDLREAIYRGIAVIDSEDAVYVERMP